MIISSLSIFILILNIIVGSSISFALDNCPEASVDNDIINPIVQNQGWLGSCGAYTMAQMADAWSASQDTSSTTNYATGPTSGLLTTLIAFNVRNRTSNHYQSINGPSIPEVYDAINSQEGNFSCSPARTNQLIMQYARSKGVNFNSESTITFLFSQANEYYNKLYQRYRNQIDHSLLMQSLENVEQMAPINNKARSLLSTLDKMAAAMCLSIVGFPASNTTLSSFQFIKELFFLDGQEKLLNYIKQNCRNESRNALRAPSPRLNRFDRASGRNSRDDHIRAFNTAFTQSPIQPVAAGYCHSILTSRRTLQMDFRVSNGSGPDTIQENLLTGKCHPHWGIVSGQYRSATGTCMVRIRSTHGPSCAKYATYLGCQNGHIWIPRNTLLDNMDEAYFFSR